MGFLMLSGGIKRDQWHKNESKRSLNVDAEDCHQESEKGNSLSKFLGI